MTKAFIFFVLLQLADLGTTAAAMALGGSEQNPLVQHLMAVGPFEGVLLAKACAVAIGVGCLVGSKTRALHLANAVFLCIVAWNLTIVVRLARI